MGTVLKNVDRIVKTDGTEFTSGAESLVDLSDVSASGATLGQALLSDGAGNWTAGDVAVDAADLGVAVDMSGSVTEYTFNTSTPTPIAGVDTAGMPAGATIVWTGASWSKSDLIIENY